MSAFMWIGFARNSFAVAPSTSDKQFLSGYEKIRGALAADDLGSAKKAASALGDTGAALAASQSLNAARMAFAKLSDNAEKLTKGQSGYYVMHCSMLNKDWVQTSAQVGNPYGGKDMVSCGEVKKLPAAHAAMGMGCCQ
jgi:hypothetical protein